MLRLPAFTYLAPHALGEAVRMLSDGGASAMAVAGGTDLYPNMKRRQFEPQVLVGLRGLRELDGIRGNERDGLTIGAATVLDRLAAHPLAATWYPVLGRAAGLISNPQIRHMGTVGGNLLVDTRCNYYNMPYWWRKSIHFCMKKDGDVCWVAPGGSKCWAISSSDLAPVMIALDAKLRLAGPAGERVIAATDLYRDDGIAHLGKRPDEILIDIQIPPPDGWRATYWKLRRRGSIDFPILGVAAAVRFDAGGTVAGARLVLGAVAPMPLRAHAAEQTLIGRTLDAGAIEAAAEAAFTPAKPLDNADLTLRYRKQMVRVYVRRALKELAGIDAEEPASHL